MRKRLCLLAVPVLLLAACQNTGTNEPLYENPYGDNPMENPQFMEDLMVFMTPGEAHAEMAKGAGDWNVAGKMWMEPGGESMPMEAKASAEMLLGGRYIMQSFKSDFMGQPFEGVMIMGHNNGTGQYFSFWMDSMGTAFADSYGHASEDGTIVLEGSMRDMMTPDGRPYRSVTRNVSADEVHIDMYDTLPDGSEWMVMQMIYTR